MSRDYFVVNVTKKEFFDVLHQQGDLAVDSDLWHDFIALMLTRWAGDEIRIMSDIDCDAYYDNYKRLEVTRNDQPLDELQWELNNIQQKIKALESK